MNPVDYALSIPTAYSRNEMQFFWEKLNERNPYSILEFGVEYGATASLYFHYWHENNACDITLVDSYIQHPELSLPKFIELPLKFPRVPFELHKMDSKSFRGREDRDSPVAPYDFIHIDASHSYEDTLNELKRSIDVAPQYFILHDFDRPDGQGGTLYEGVGKAAREFFKREPNERVETCALYKL